MSTTHHMSQSIRGPLINWTESDWQAATKWVKKNDGTAYDVNGLKNAFLDELAKGHEVIPLGECNNFDFKTGCKGHAE